MGRHGENIRKRKDGRWEGRYKIFDQDTCKSMYRSVYGPTYEEVKEKLSRVRFGFIGAEAKKQEQSSSDCSSDHGETDSAVLFSQAAVEWLEEVANKRKYSTYVKYSTVYQIHLAGILSGCRLSASVIQDLHAKIFDHLSRENLSESLQKSICCVANQILDYANQKYSANIQLLKRPSVKLKKKTVQIFSKADQARILGCIYRQPDKFKIAVLLCLYTGLRLGELCAIKWTDIDWKGMTLTVRRTVQRISAQGYQSKTILLESEPKSESSKRTIPLTAEIIKQLEQLKEEQFKEEQPYVFGGKKPMDPRTMQYRFKKILKEAEVEEQNFHILRHTFATNCVENCMDVKALSEVLGHSDVKITLNRYIHPTMDLKRKQIGRLPDFYGQICGQAA